MSYTIFNSNPIFGIQGYTYGYVGAINNNGDVCGGLITNDFSIYSAFIRKANGEIINAGYLGVQGMINGQFNSINNNGDAAGEVNDNGTIFGVIRKSDGTVIECGHFGVQGMGHAYISDINDNGDVVGSVCTHDYSIWKAIIRKADGTIIDCGHFGIQGMTKAWFNSINNNGDAVAVASSSDYSEYHAVIRKADGTIIDCEQFGIQDMNRAWFDNINNNGDASATVCKNWNDYRIIIRKSNGTVIDLGVIDPVTYVLQNFGFNDRGDIAGSVWDAGWTVEYPYIIPFSHYADEYNIAAKEAFETWLASNPFPSVNSCTGNDTYTLITPILDYGTSVELYNIAKNKINLPNIEQVIITINNGEYCCRKVYDVYENGDTLVDIVPPWEEYICLCWAVKEV